MGRPQHKAGCLTVHAPGRPVLEQVMTPLALLDRDRNILSVNTALGELARDYQLDLSGNCCTLICQNQAESACLCDQVGRWLPVWHHLSQNWLAQVLPFESGFLLQMRQKESPDRTGLYQDLLFGITRWLLSLPSDRIEEGIDFALAEIGHFLDVDRCYLFKFDAQKQTISESHEWASEQVAASIDGMQDIPVAEIPWFWEQLSRFAPVFIHNVSLLPPEASREKALCRSRGVQSLLAAPVVLDGGLYGFLGVSSVRITRPWSEPDARLLRMVGEFISANLERQRASLASRASDRRFIAMTDAVPALIWEMSPSGLVGYGNRCWHEYTGQAVGKNALADFVHEKDRSQVEAMMDACRRGQVRSAEMRMRRADGSYRWMNVTAAPQRHDDELVLINCSGFDITDHRIAEEQLLALNDDLEVRVAERTDKLQKAFDDLKQAQAKLLQNEKMASIGQLAAGVAHEINNPVGFIRSNLTTLGKYVDKMKSYITALETIGEDLPPDRRDEMKRLRKQFKVGYLFEDIPDLLAESIEGADRVRTIVQNLKSFSRVDQSQYAEIDINECLENTINIVWNELKYKTTLHRDFGELPRIRCYPQQLNQVFMNILVNAAQAIETQGDIWVRTFVEGENLVVHFQDNGCGIPEEIRERIFEPFFTTKEVSKGTGLGMSISWDIIQKHGGRIEVESEVGTGTSFIIYLPLSGAPSPDTEDPAPSN